MHQHLGQVARGIVLALLAPSPLPRLQKLASVLVSLARVDGSLHKGTPPVVTRLQAALSSALAQLKQGGCAGRAALAPAPSLLPDVRLGRQVPCGPAARRPPLLTTWAVSWPRSPRRPSTTARPCRRRCSASRPSSGRLPTSRLAATCSRCRPSSRKLISSAVVRTLVNCARARSMPSSGPRGVRGWRARRPRRAHPRRRCDMSCAGAVRASARSGRCSS